MLIGSILGVDDQGSRLNALCSRSTYVVGVVEHFIRHYHGDEQARALCESFDAVLRVLCLEMAEAYYETFQI
jgi:hypothetical protein